MCLIFLSLRNHPAYKLIVAANRDEFYGRKTAAVDYWNDHPEIIGGRDLEAQGTWMAMTLSGKISLVTNYRDPANINPNAPSRGRLVSDYLEKNTDAETYLRDIEKKGKTYNGFNLIAGSQHELWYYSNYQEGIRQLLPGNYGLSNHLLDSPWPKVARGKKMFEEILKKPKVTSYDLFELLYNGERAPDNELPDTGIGIDRERALSSMFIKSPGYGTRSSTVVMVDHHDNVRYSERVYDLETFNYTVKTFGFSIDRRK